MATEKNRRGRPTWVTGTKFLFLDQYASEWQQATDAGLGPAGKFYTKVAKHFIKKYGWYFDRWSDKDCPDPGPDALDDDGDDDGQQGLLNDEVVKRNQYYQDIRNCIMAWFHSHYTKVDNNNDPGMDQLFNDITDAIPKAPRRMRMTQYYSKYYYNTRIKATFETDWAAILAMPGLQSDKPSRINILNNVTSRLWENESSTFKSWLEKKRDTEHAKEVEEHQKLVKELQTIPNSPETYHAALNNAASFMQPFADVMAKKFGAAVSVLMVLPIGEKNGEIELRSVHSGTTKHSVPMTWPIFDRSGFAEVQKSMINFGRHVFSSVDRTARSTGGPSISGSLGPPATTPSTDVPNAPPPGGVTGSDPSMAAPSSTDAPYVSPPSGAVDSNGTLPGESLGSNALSNGPNNSDDLSHRSPDSGSTDLRLGTLPPDNSARNLGLSSTPTPGTPTPIVTGGAPAAPQSSSLRGPSMPPDTPNSDDRPSRSPSPQLNPTPAPVQIDMPAHSKAIYQAVLQDTSKLGAVWSECVAAFVAFEKAAGFQLQDDRLPASVNRPRQLGEWFKHGRKVSGNAWDSFCDGDPVAFGECWWSWWSDIQPKNRGRDEAGKPSRDGVDIEWNTLRKPGPSGVFLVLVALLWWRFRLTKEGSPTTAAKWEDAATDVIWVLGQLTDGYDTGSKNAKGAPQTKKRKSTSGNEASGKKRKR